MALEQLYFILADQQLNQTYESFLQKNYAWENFGFVRKVQEFRKLSGDNQRKREAQYIYINFIEEDALHELGDLTFMKRQHIKNSIENPPEDLFDELYDIAIDSLANSTVNDFLRDSLYTNYVSSQFVSQSQCKPQRVNIFSSILLCIH